MKREAASTPLKDEKPLLDDDELAADNLPDVKPTVHKKRKGGADYAVGGKQALAQLIVELGLKALPSNQEICDITGLTPAQVRTQLDPRTGVRRKLVTYAQTLG